MSSVSAEARLGQHNPVSLRMLSRQELKMKPFEAIDFFLQTSRQLLKPGVSDLDVLTAVYFPVMDILNPFLKRDTSVTFCYAKGEAIGFIFTRKGHGYRHEYDRHHIYLPGEYALSYITQLCTTDTRSSQLAFAVILKDEGTLMKDGFTEPQILELEQYGWRARRSKKTGETIETYTKTHLTKGDLDASRTEIQSLCNPLPTTWPPIIGIDLSTEFTKGLQPRVKHIEMKRLLQSYFPEVYKFHQVHNPHSSLADIDLVPPNYGVFFDGVLVATAGFSAQEYLSTKNYGYKPMYVASNLVVHESHRRLGLGRQLAFTIRKMLFNIEPEAVVFTDSTPITTKISIEEFNAHPISKSGWFVLDRQ